MDLRGLFLQTRLFFQLAPPGSEDPFAAISRILDIFSKIIIGNNSFDLVSYKAVKRVILAPEKTIMW